MTEVEKRDSLFDNMFHAPKGRYVIQLKSGLKAVVTSRTEIWKDKTACYWVTFALTCGEFDVSGINTLDELLYCFDGKERELDVRYNEISAIWCI